MKITAKGKEINRGREVPGAIVDHWAYDVVFDLEAYCKRKRKWRTVILADNLMPQECAVCGEQITVENNDNLTQVWPRSRKIAPMHYKCAWSALFKDLFDLARVINV